MAKKGEAVKVKAEPKEKRVSSTRRQKPKNEPLVGQKTLEFMWKRPGAPTASPSPPGQVKQEPDLQSTIKKEPVDEPAGADPTQIAAPAAAAQEESMQAPESSLTDETSDALDAARAKEEPQDVTNPSAAVSAESATPPSPDSTNYNADDTSSSQGVLAGPLAALFGAATERESALLLLEALESLPEPPGKAPEADGEKTQREEEEATGPEEGPRQVETAAPAAEPTGAAELSATSAPKVLTTPEPCKAAPTSLTSATPADVAKVARPLRDRLAQRLKLTGKQPLMTELATKPSEIIASELLPEKKSHNFLGGMPFRWRMLLLKNSKALQAKKTKKGRRKAACRSKATQKPKLKLGKMVSASRLSSMLKRG